MLSLAISIAAQAFEWKYDKGGKPYVLHCLHVMDDVAVYEDEELMVIAVLHDIVEDTDWTLARLACLDFSDRVVTGVDYLTHDKSMSYEEYIEKIMENSDAIIVKRADLRHNSDITRIKGVTDKDFLRIARYHCAYTLLKEFDGLG